MKKRYVVFLTIAAFSLGALLANLFVSYKFNVDKYTPWGIYVSKNLKFSIEYPRNLVPKETHYKEGHNDGSTTISGGLVEWAPFLNVIPVVSIMVEKLQEPKEWVQSQPKEKYWTSPEENRAGARIYHGEKTYIINIENLDLEYSERILKSLKFLE